MAAVRSRRRGTAYSCRATSAPVVYYLEVHPPSIRPTLLSMFAWRPWALTSNPRCQPGSPTWKYDLVDNLSVNFSWLPSRRPSFLKKNKKTVSGASACCPSVATPAFRAALKWTSGHRGFSRNLTLPEPCAIFTPFFRGVAFRAAFSCSRGWPGASVHGTARERP